MGQLVYLKDVVTLEVFPDLCVGCGMCTVVCPHQVLAVEDKRVAVTDRDACMECGACAVNCPSQAIAVQSGVGCAAAVINAALGKSGSECCCVVETTDKDGRVKQAGCC